ncbi:helix-turn-helix domain-containing protein [Salinicola peritrichatus]|uniref:helix-turn-helix domain-containing protein n=1 Tax=Salinicola peritrichatus TaxID=1267424 RepID=UPI00195509DF|nr:AraC family transcriptional regulator [Salinicola peritrichatus]
MNCCNGCCPTWLAAGETPVDVAGQFGFADQSHLGRWFRRAYGMTPADYRRQCQRPA